MDGYVSRCWKESTVPDVIGHTKAGSPRWEKSREQTRNRVAYTVACATVPVIASPDRCTVGFRDPRLTAARYLNDNGSQ